MKKIVLILFAVLCGAVAAVAQKAVVETFEAAPMDVTAQQYARLDLHGEKCALVKVRVVAQGVTFSGNVMGEVEKRGSEYWVYMPGGTKMLQVTAETFLPFLHTFPEPLRPGVTYILTVLAPQVTIVPALQQPVADPYAADIALTNQYEPFKDPISQKWCYKYKGHVVIPAIYDLANSFDEGLAGVKINGKRGFIDKNNTLVIPAIYNDAQWFTEGLAPVQIDNKWGFINKKGSLVIPAIYDGAGVFGDGLAPVKINNKYGFINKTGALAIPVKYDGAWLFSEGLAPVCIDNKWGFIDKNDTLVIPPIYNEAGYFSEGLAWVLINNLCGYIDKTGTIIIPARYYSAWNFYGGISRVKINGKYGFIDKTGTIIIPAIYDYADPFRRPFTERTMVVQNGRKFYIDRNGNEVDPTAPTASTSSVSSSDTSHSNVISLPGLGCVLQEAPKERFETLDIDHGVVMNEIKKGPLKDCGIRDGFIVLFINNTRIASPHDVEKAYQDALKNTDDKVLFIKGLYPNGKRVFYATEVM